MLENEDRINKIIAGNLVRLLREKNRTQLELGEYLGVTQATVSNWCNGIKMPRMDKIDRICDFFGVRRSALMSASPLEDELEHFDALFIRKYGKEGLCFIDRFMQLDDEDKARISERIDTMLESEKYKKGSSGEKVI